LIEKFNPIIPHIHPSEMELPKTKHGLSTCCNQDTTVIEIGIDEAGKGPMFGRVYAAAAILPRINDTDTFSHEDLRDSKKIKSHKKLSTLADYIKENALAWSVCYETEQSIDKINIRQATFKAMHNAIKDVIGQAIRKGIAQIGQIELLVDGNDFKPYMTMNGTMFRSVPHSCYEGGDNRFTPIAAASILAKTERDTYILELCENHPELKERYSIHTNKGYGTKKHMDGIQEHGITQWHRRSYGICKNYA
jgi:ribonuclease HII